MNIGIIGCGNIASAHIKALTTNQDITKIILYDPDNMKVNKRIEETTKPTHIAVDLKELAKMSDCFIVCTPNNLHKKVIEEVLSYNSIPFICEKPLASTVEDAKVIKNIAPTGSAISFNYRFNYIFSFIKEYAISEQLGKLLFFSAEFNKNSALIRKELTWRDRADQTSSSGALGDLSCHLLDMFCWMTNSRINLQTLQVALGTRVKEKQDFCIDVDDNGYIFGENETNSFFKIKASKSELDDNLGLHLNIIFQTAEIIYSTKRENIITVKRMDSTEIIELEINQNHILPDPEREIPYWADSFHHIHRAWFSRLLQKSENINLPSLSDGIHIQEIISYIGKNHNNK